MGGVEGGELAGAPAPTCGRGVGVDAGRGGCAGRAGVGRGVRAHGRLGVHGVRRVRRNRGRGKSRTKGNPNATPEEVQKQVQATFRNPFLDLSCFAGRQRLTRSAPTVDKVNISRTIILVHVMSEGLVIDFDPHLAGVCFAVASNLKAKATPEAGRHVS